MDESLWEGQSKYRTGDIWGKIPWYEWVHVEAADF